MSTRSKPLSIFSWLLQLGIIVILAQTLYFKFTFAPETQYIFRDIGGRPAATAAGAMELLSVILLLIPRTAALGALLALGTMGGAIMTHLTKIGIKIPNFENGVQVAGDDGGLLFGMALGVALASLIVLIIRRRELPVVGKFLP